MAQPKAESATQEIEGLLFWQHVLNTHVKDTSQLVKVLQNEHQKIMPDLERLLCGLLSSLPQETQTLIHDQALVMSGTTPQGMTDEEAAIVREDLKLPDTKDTNKWFDFAWDADARNDYTRAFKWYTKAAQTGHKKAQNNLARYYEEGKVVDKDMKMAVMLYTKSAQGGNATAQCNLACCYLQGNGVERDTKQAMEWYSEAARNGSSAAQYNLGIFYEQGLGVDQALNTAFKWYAKSAVNGYSPAQYKLATCYEQGHGVEKDHKKAIEWYTEAATGGNAEAKQRLKELGAT